MAARTIAVRLLDIISAIDHVRDEAEGASLEIFKSDWRKLWVVERGIEIISEASRTSVMR